VEGYRVPLVVRERPRLEQDGLGYQVLAEVVQVRAEFYLVESVSGRTRADGGGEGAREPRRGVAVRVYVAVKARLLVASKVGSRAQ
jgi:hypothetical protein